MTLEFSWQIVKKYSDTKFHDNPSSGTLVVRCGRTDGWHTTANSHFRNFGNMPKNGLQKDIIRFNFGLNVFVTTLEILCLILHNHCVIIFLI
jgi:hypothetical protein